MRRVLAFAALALFAAHGAAQVTLAPSEALRCMTPPESERGVPEYDEESVRRKDAGTVQVELTFTAPDQPPQVRQLSPAVASALEAAVARHVRKLRIPCLQAAQEPVRVQLEFVFRPDDGRQVFGLPPQDAADESRRRQVSCLTRITPGEPTYPRLALEAGEHGNFLVRLRFTSATEAPAASIIAGPRSRALRRAVLDFVPGFRLPCLTTPPIELDALYHFRLDGAERTVIKDMTLLSLLRASERFPKPVYFRFEPPDCPFDVKVSLLQPYAPNRVVQVGDSRPARRPFLNWLAAIEPRLSESTRLAVLGDSFTVSVPCGTIDL